MITKDRYAGSNKIRERMLSAMRDIIVTRSDVTSRMAFAEIIGTTPARINAWENNQGYPTREDMFELCIQFGVNGDWLLAGRGTMYGDAGLVIRIHELEKKVAKLEKRAGIHRET